MHGIRDINAVSQNTMSSPVYMFDGGDPEMGRASERARGTFRFFWRELSWERRRIVPGLDMTLVKLPFTDGPRIDENPEFEHMWVDDIEFDGSTLTGRLINAPNWIRSVKEGDPVSAPFSQLGDWMMTVDGVVYGAYSVNLMRTRMGRREREQHDAAWGLDFGDPTQIRVTINRDPSPKRSLTSRLFGRSRQNSIAEQPDEGFSDHPMCTNMLPKVEEQLQSDPSVATTKDELGWTLLHRESLAGNLGVVRLLVRFGADIEGRTPEGRNAAALAKEIGWQAIANYLENEAKAEQRRAANPLDR